MLYRVKYFRDDRWFLSIHGVEIASRLCASAMELGAKYVTMSLIGRR